MAAAILALYGSSAARLQRRPLSPGFFGLEVAHRGCPFGLLRADHAVRRFET
jgi:hypothetical protein